MGKLGKVVGEEYYPLGNTNFNSLINKIKVAKPDCIFCAVVGGSNVAFYKQLKAAGITGDKQFLLTLSVTEDEMTGVGGENFAGFYSSMKYFQSLDNDNNKKFVAAFKAKYGPASVIGDVTQAGYLGPWLWKAAVEKAGSFDVDKVVAASPGIELKDRARGLREARREPPPLEQGAHRPGPAGRHLQGGCRVARTDQARSLPQGISVIHSRINLRRGPIWRFWCSPYLGTAPLLNATSGRLATVSVASDPHCLSVNTGAPHHDPFRDASTSPRCKALQG